MGGSADGLEALREALAVEGDSRVREAIFTSLATLGTADSIGAIMAYVRSQDSQLRTGAIDALRAIPQAVEPFLTELLTDADSDVRLLTCEIVRGLPAPVATRMLAELLDRETEANVCASALEVLAEIGEASALPAIGRCGERFADVPFLAFSARVARQRISDQRG